MEQSLEQLKSTLEYLQSKGDLSELKTISLPLEGGKTIFYFKSDDHKYFIEKQTKYFLATCHGLGVIFDTFKVRPKSADFPTSIDFWKENSIVGSLSLNISI